MYLWLLKLTLALNCWHCRVFRHNCSTLNFCMPCDRNVCDITHSSKWVRWWDLEVKIEKKQKNNNNNHELLHSLCFCYLFLILELCKSPEIGGLMVLTAPLHVLWLVHANSEDGCWVWFLCINVQSINIWIFDVVGLRYNCLCLWSNILDFFCSFFRGLKVLWWVPSGYMIKVLPITKGCHIYSWSSCCMLHLTLD